MDGLPDDPHPVLPLYILFQTGKGQGLISPYPFDKIQECPSIPAMETSPLHDHRIVPRVLQEIMEHKMRLTILPAFHLPEPKVVEHQQGVIPSFHRIIVL